MQHSTKDEVLRRLLEAEETPVSGQQLADQLQVSRTAIWKHVQKLQEEGYSIETVKKHGYVLKASRTAFLSSGEIARFLSTKQFGRNVYVHDVVESTQLLAHELVANDAENGTVVVAEAQTAGRGRLMREWDSAAKKGLWFTVIVRPNCLPHEAPQFTLITAVAVVNAIKAMLPTVTPQIKWPNDVLINGKKITGILTEMVADTDHIRALLIGIGINANHELHDFPDALHTIATSLKMETGMEINRAELLANVLLYLENYSELYLKHGFARIKPLWEEASCTIGEFVRATTVRDVIEGKALAITDQGVLQIEKVDGSIAEVYSADIELM